MPVTRPKVRGNQALEGTKTRRSRRHPRTEGIKHIRVLSFPRGNTSIKDKAEGETSTLGLSSVKCEKSHWYLPHSEGIYQVSVIRTLKIKVHRTHMKFYHEQIVSIEQI